MEVDWCFCGRQTAEGELYCSPKCRALDSLDHLKKLPNLEVDQSLPKPLLPQQQLRLHHHQQQQQQQQKTQAQPLVLKQHYSSHDNLNDFLEDSPLAKEYEAYRQQQERGKASSPKPQIASKLEVVYTQNVTAPQAPHAVMAYPHLFRSTTTTAPTKQSHSSSRPVNQHLLQEEPELEPELEAPTTTGAQPHNHSHPLSKHDPLFQVQEAIYRRGLPFTQELQVEKLKEDHLVELMLSRQKKPNKEKLFIQKYTTKS